MEHFKIAIEWFGAGLVLGLVAGVIGWIKRGWLIQELNDKINGLEAAIQGSTKPKG